MTEKKEERVEALARMIRSAFEFCDEEHVAVAGACLDELLRLLRQAHPRVEQARFATGEYRVEDREGMVTVWDHAGRYLGCMGNETWQAALREAAGR